MNDTIQIARDGYNNTETAPSQPDGEALNAVHIFQKTLNFLSFAMNRRNISPEQYSSINDQFIR